MSDWVLLRGLAREARHWGKIPALFEENLSARVFTPDNPGCGTEAARKAPLTIAETVEDVRARVLAGDNPPRAPFALMGLSLGGMIALEWAARHPTEVSRVVVANTSTGDLSPPLHRLRPSALRILAGAAASRDFASRERAGFRMTLNDPAVITPELLEEWVKIQESAPVKNSTFIRQLTASIRFRAPRELSCPLLILSSSQDRMVDPRCSRAIAAHYRMSHLRLHPTAGHDLPLEDPEWVVARVAEWIMASALRA